MVTPAIGFLAAWCIKNEKTMAEFNSCLRYWREAYADSCQHGWKFPEGKEEVFLYCEQLWGSLAE